MGARLSKPRVCAERDVAGDGAFVVGVAAGGKMRAGTPARFDPGESPEGASAVPGRAAPEGAIGYNDRRWLLTRKGRR